MTSADNTILTDIKVEIAMLKQEVSFINKLFERMEVLIQKVDTQYETLVDKTSKIDYNFAGTKDELEDLYEMLTVTEKQINQKIDSIEKSLEQKIDTTQLRITTLEAETGSLLESKWKILGGGAVIMWIISNLEFIKKIFH